MRLSDFKARLAEDERRTQEESQDKAKKLNQYLANDPDVQVFRSKYLKLFKAIAHDCGRQANLHVEETSIPAKTTISSRSGLTKSFSF